MFWKTPPDNATRSRRRSLRSRWATARISSAKPLWKRAEMTRAGFQLTARVKDGGAQAGTLAAGAADAARVKVEVQGDVQYAGQALAGAAVEGGVARWTVEWTAPAGGGPVVFNVSANAADGNESADGDFVYTAIAEAAPPP